MTAFSSRRMTEQDWARTTYFQATEFTEPLKMGYEFIQWLERVRSRANVPMSVSSSYRSSVYNKSVGGAADSAHTDDPCSAVDFRKTPTPDDPNWNRARFAIIAAALAEGCTRIGFYPNGSLHLDRTEDKRPGRCIWNAVDRPA